MTVDRKQREQILRRVERLVVEKYYDPEFDSAKWRALVDASAPKILESGSGEHFERQMHELVSQLGSSHTAFYHKDWRPLPPRQSICATLLQCETEDGPRWMFQDVQEGGPAHLAGIRKGDLLLNVDAAEIRPPERLLLRPGRKVRLQVRNGGSAESFVDVQAPLLRAKQPFSTPQAVVGTNLAPDIGYLKVNMFPGIVGIDVARDIDTAISSFGNRDRLIVDLRGNSGGGIGCLRLMSYLTPDKLPIGYSLSRARARNGYEKEKLTRFDRIPSRKIYLLWLLLRYGFIDHSLALITEGLGSKPFHGRIAVLVNEHSASASEMVAAFAAENKLALIVGTRTPGRLVGSKPFKLPHGFFVILPVGAYLTWQGRRLEGQGIQPDVDVPLSHEYISDGNDNQMEAAVEFVRGL